MLARGKISLSGLLGNADAAGDGDGTCIRRMFYWSPTARGASRDVGEEPWPPPKMEIATSARERESIHRSTRRASGYPLSLLTLDDPGGFCLLSAPALGMPT